MEPDYDSEVELDESERKEIYEVSEKIERQTEVLDEADLEIISNSTRLRDKYKNRWWSHDIEAYFISTVNPGQKFKSGEQLYGCYGVHSNSYFLEK